MEFNLWTAPPLILNQAVTAQLTSALIQQVNSAPTPTAQGVRGGPKMKPACWD